MPTRLNLQHISVALRRTGWIRFWLQAILGVVVISILLFNNIGNRLTANSDRVLGLGPGLSLTTLSFIVLLYSLWQGRLIIAKGRALNSVSRPSKKETINLIKNGLVSDLLGLLFAALGYQALSGSLFIQASLQIPGFFSSNPASNFQGVSLAGYPITSIEMLSVLSNTQVLFAHLLGLLLTLWLLKRVYNSA
ncbi:hypothetical protein PMYN1_Chma7 (chromatophore) [Paulinella micropora]|uniref:DUF3611 family protein n=1 Tax=Paulinella micropora TaxID=1928728 RepID=A0A1L5YAX0_9EUKA|nr:hypothetical protein PMNZ_041 [Paulinella micropora]APP87846.1 hypothetical protein PCKR_041 [Paulinella micropora]AQX44613.1 hypothetical protein PFK_041 [Paulinella micropora]AXY63004.1 hypothetical protein PMNZ_041 [Paulinella micropora]BBL85820.1 hypothetical protein PMYN1_Chma7 [Paulinella micropora]